MWQFSWLRPSDHCHLTTLLVFKKWFCPKSSLELAYSNTEILGLLVAKIKLNKIPWVWRRCCCHTPSLVLVFHPMAMTMRWLSLWVWCWRGLGGWRGFWRDEHSVPCWGGGRPRSVVWSPSSWDQVVGLPRGPNSYFTVPWGDARGRAENEVFDRYVLLSIFSRFISPLII